MTSKWLQSCFKTVNWKSPLHPIPHGRQHRVKRRSKCGQNGIKRVPHEGRKAVKRRSKRCQKEGRTCVKKEFKRCQKDVKRVSKGLHKGFEGLQTGQLAIPHPIQRPPHGPSKDHHVKPQARFPKPAKTHMR